MKALGFDYMPAAFVANAGTSSEANLVGPYVGVLEVRDAEIVGYGGVFQALTVLTPRGEPRSEQTAGSLQAYDRALLGDAFGSSHVHNGAGEAGIQVEDTGCRGVGIEARLALSDNPTFDELSPNFRELRERFLSRVSDLDGFEAFRVEWVACMSEAGFEPLSGDPLTQGPAYLSRALPAATAEMFSLFEVEAAVGEGILLDTRQLEAIDYSWLEEVVSEYQSLDALLEEEIATAVADERCRSSNRVLIESEVQQLRASLESALD